MNLERRFAAVTDGTDIRPGRAPDLEGSLGYAKLRLGRDGIQELMGPKRFPKFQYDTRACSGPTTLLALTRVRFFFRRHFAPVGSLSGTPSPALTSVLGPTVTCDCSSDSASARDFEGAGICAHHRRLFCI